MSARRSTGVFLIASGGIGIFIGFVLSASGIGAICGILMVIISIIFIIWGYLMKAKDQEIKDQNFSERMLMTQAVASGVNICPQCKTPNSNTSPVCSGCGYGFVPAGNAQVSATIDPVFSAHKSKQAKDYSDLINKSDSTDG